MEQPTLRHLCGASLRSFLPQKWLHYGCPLMRALCLIKGVKKLKDDPYPWEITRPYLIDIGLFLFMIIIGVASFYGSFIEWKCETNWFQRSGAILVLISAVLEYRHLNIYQKTHYHQAAASGGITRGRHLSVIIIGRVFIGKLAIYTLVFGTFISGYGDLLFE